MLKVLIADDEPKIRRGLAEALPWEEMGMEICGSAPNGECAIQEVCAKQPDICLIDICMPLLNGLDLIQKIYEEHPDTICIIITGYDEFEYARQAVRMGVFDYILKPVNEEQLKDIIDRAKAVITERRNKNVHMRQAEKMLKEHLPLLRERVLNQILMGALDAEEIREALSFHEISFSGDLCLWRITPSGTDDLFIQKDWDRQLWQFVLRNISEEVLGHYGTVYTFFDAFDRLLLFLDMKDENQMYAADAELKAVVNDCMKTQLQTRVARAGGPESMFLIYQGWEEEDRKHLSGLVLQARKFLEENFSDSDVSAQQTAEWCGVSPAYLSRLFRAEMGTTLIDYLTKIRMQRALVLLEQTDLRIYEVAEKVGYKSQHYFCAAFKKILDVSPTDYRQSRER